MQRQVKSDEQANFHFVSTGRLPTPEMVQSLVAEAHARFKSNAEGENSQVYPALARVPRDLFGVCVVGTSGSVYAAGDTDHPFSIMSVSKPFMFALVCQEIGAEQARERGPSQATFQSSSLPDLNSSSISPLPRRLAWKFHRPSSPAQTR